MAKFDPYIRTFLNNIYDDKFVNEIQDNINEILPLIIEGKLHLPESNEINNELLSSLKLYDINFYKTLTFDTIINGIRNKTGFNRLSILTMFFEQDTQQFLNSIPNNFTQISIQLDQIAKGFDYNFRFFKCLNQSIQKYDSLNIDLINDTDIQYRVFNYLFNRINNTSDSGKISFLYLFSFIILYLGYSKLTKYQTSIFYYISDSNRLTLTDIGNGFNSYFSSNKVNIINTLENYCYKNIFNFNGTYTTLFDSKIDLKLGQSLSRLVSIFRNNISEFTAGNLFLTKLISTCVDQHSYYTALHWLDNVNSEDDDIPFYEYQSNLFNIDLFASLILEEDRIYEEIKTSAITNIDTLENIEYVAWQFNSSPIYFLNSYTTLHYQYASDIVDSMQSPFNIDSWNQKFEFTNDRNDKLIEYLTGHNFVFSGDLIKQCSYFLFSDLITTFLNSDLVTSWIISDFFPELLNAINENYYKKIDIYKFVDKIRWMLKLILIKDIFDGKLFNTYIHELSSYFESKINDNYNVTLTDINLNLMFLNYPKSQLLGILNGIYKSAFVNDYLNTLTRKYSI